MVYEFHIPMGPVTSSPVDGGGVGGEESFMDFTETTGSTSILEPESCFGDLLLMLLELSTLEAILLLCCCQLDFGLAVH
jgi:hypothetical protein